MMEVISFLHDMHIYLIAAFAVTSTVTSITTAIQNASCRIILLIANIAVVFTLTASSATNTSSF